MKNKKVFRGDRLRAARERAGMTQQEFAQAVGIGDGESGKTQVSRYENSKIEPQTHILKSMAEALNVSIDWLLGLTDDPTGVLTESSLSSDEMAVLNAYRQNNVEKMMQLGFQRRPKPPGDQATES